MEDAPQPNQGFPSETAFIRTFEGQNYQFSPTPCGIIGLEYTADGDPKYAGPKVYRALEDVIGSSTIEVRLRAGKGIQRPKGEYWEIVEGAGDSTVNPRRSVEALLAPFGTAQWPGYQCKEPIANLVVYRASHPHAGDVYAIIAASHDPLVGGVIVVPVPETESQPPAGVLQRIREVVRRFGGSGTA